MQVLRNQALKLLIPPEDFVDSIWRSLRCLLKTGMVGFCGWPLLLAAGDQPQWGQTFSRNMVSAETNLPAHFDPTSRRQIKWSIELGTAVYSTPVVARGRIIIGTNNYRPRQAKHRGDRGVLMCFHENDGRLAWQLVVPKQPHDPYLDCPGVGITASASVDENQVYVVSNRGEVLALDLEGQVNGNDGPFLDESRLLTPEKDTPFTLDASDADVLWVFDLRREVGAYTHDSANLSVLVHGPFLYVSTPNGVNYTHRHRPSPETPGLVVLDKKTGKLLAQDVTGIGARVFHSTFSSPSMAEVKGRRLVFYGGGDGVCYAFEALDPARRGEYLSLRQPLSLREVWRFDGDPTAPKENISQYQGNRSVSPSSIIGMPVVEQDHVYLAVGGDPWHGKRQAWLKCLDATQTGDTTRTGEVWSYPLVRHSVATPAVSQSLVFMGDFGQQFHCVDARTGRAHWVHDCGSEIWASPLVADGKVYVATREGQVLVFAVAPEKKLLHQADFGEEIYASPVAANGTLYLATRTRLYAMAPGGH